jgi:hypothetical protein
LLVLVAYCRFVSVNYGIFWCWANTPECEAYRAQMRAIDDANRAAFAAWQILNKAYIEGSL